MRDLWVMTWRCGLSAARARSWIPRMVVCGVAASICACGDRKPQRSHAPQSAKGDALDSVVEWHGDIQLEENEKVLNVLPYAAVDPHGGFLVWDEQEAQIRQYGPEGRLRGYFGRKGEGPKEFQFPRAAIRRASGTILAFDTYARGAEFDEVGSAVLRTFRTPVGPLHSALLLDDSLVVLGGQVTGSSGDAAPSRLHVWSLAGNTVRRSFFAPSLPSQVQRLAANTAGFVSADRRGDVIAATFSLRDTIYFFDLQGKPRGQVPMPSQFYRRLSSESPLPSQKGGVVGAREWIGSFSLISNVFWASDDTLIVQYQDRVGTEPRWRLLGLRRDGSRLFEVVDSPYLITVDQANGWLYFVKPGSPTPNFWSRARLR